MKYWLKGALIGLVIGLVLLTLLYSGSFFSKSSNGPSDNFNIIGKIVNAPLDLLFPCSGESCMGRIVLIPLELIVVPFLIGAIIGWIFGKFKNSK